MTGPTSKAMSRRKLAKKLLVLWQQGKRKLSPELEARYRQLVTTGYKQAASEGEGRSPKSYIWPEGPGW